jgi:sensor histidine kinase YesM
MTNKIISDILINILELIKEGNASMKFKQFMLTRWGSFILAIIGSFFFVIYPWPTSLMSINTLTKVISLLLYAGALGIGIWQSKIKK